MAKMYISFLLDFYQPPTQSEAILNRVTKECYLPMAKLFNCALNPKFTISIAHSLVELLERFGWEGELVRLVNQALDSHTIEMVHTGAYHPVFPMLPTEEIERQILLDIEFKERKIGNRDVRGILSPDYCYADWLINLFRGMGYRWTVIDDQIMNLKGIAVPEEKIYQINGFTVFMRSGFWSDMLRKKKETNEYWTGRDFVRHMKAEAAGKNRDCYKILALSGETFGHHIPYYQETFLRDMLFELQKCDSVKLCFLSELLELAPFQKVEKERLPTGYYFPDSSAATHAEDLARGDPYPHWKSSKNLVHEKLWKLTNLVLSGCQHIDFRDGRHAGLRELLDRAFYSDQYFSASVWYWNPMSIFEGIDLQMRALYRYVQLINDPVTFQEGKRVYTEIVWEIFKQDEEYRKSRGKLA
jgi:hypothetical protein